MNTEKILYLDMDGVLADLYGYMSKKYFGGNSIYDYTQETVKEILERGTMTEELFCRVPPNPKLDDLVESIQILAVDFGWDVEALSSCGSVSEDASYLAEIKRQKGWWLEQHLPSGLVSNLNVVSHCHQKGDYATPHNYLIDDKEDNCKVFEKNGGRACKYTMDPHHEHVKSLVNIQTDLMVFEIA